MEDTFVDEFEIHHIDEKSPIISHIVQIVDKVNVEDIEIKENLMDWSDFFLKIRYLRRSLLGLH